VVNRLINLIQNSAKVASASGIVAIRFIIKINLSLSILTHINSIIIRIHTLVVKSKSYQQH
jgi:hypothetical protein